MEARLIGASLLSVALVGTTLVGACGAKKGALILAINTDMKAPQDVNAVSVTVSTNGAIKDSFIGRVTPDGDVLLPATLAIIEPDDPNASIRVRVMAFQEQKPRVLRDVKTTVPREGRTALLRIPLNFVDDGALTGAPLPPGVLPPAPVNGGASGSSANGGAADFDFFSAFQPACPDIENQTSIDGECADNSVDPAALPDYADNLVFGTGKNGADKNGCFDVAKCYGGAAPIQDAMAGSAPAEDAGTQVDAGPAKQDVTAQAVSLDRNTCILQLNGADASQLNLAVVTPDTGECVKAGECYIPIDQGPSGWQVQGGSVQLPTFVCKLLGKGLRLFSSIATCAAKTESQPICRPAPNNPTPAGTGPLACLTDCGTCVTQHCDPNAIAACFGADYANGNVSGRCKDLYMCGCSCKGSFATCACSAQSFGSPPGDCQTCLTDNLNACVEASCKTQCSSNGVNDGGTPPGTTANVHLTFTPGQPAPSPAVGTAFDATSGQSLDPVPGDVAVVANSTTGSIGTLKVEWCAGTFTQGKTFTQFSKGPGCTNGLPVVDFTAGGGHWVTGSAIDGAGTLTVQSLNPLALVFQGVRLDGDTSAKSAGSFTIQGAGAWNGVVSP